MQKEIEQISSNFTVLKSASNHSQSIHSSIAVLEEKAQNLIKPDEVSTPKCQQRALLTEELLTLECELKTLEQRGDSLYAKEVQTELSSLKRHITKKHQGINSADRNKKISEDTATSQNDHPESQVNIYQFQRLQRVNLQLVRENQNLKDDIAKHTVKLVTKTQNLNTTLTENRTINEHLQQQLHNKDCALRGEQSNVTDLQQQVLVLQQAVENYDQLKAEDNKLQLEYQRSLQNVLQARKDKSLIEQQVNALKNQQQEMEINCRQLNHEKMGALSEMRAMKKVFEQERKNVAERYERIVQKLEAEMAYTQQMYQDLKETHRNLQRRYEHDQPQYERLKQKLEAERDVFQHKLNDVVVSHVSNLNMISNASNVASKNVKMIFGQMGTSKIK